MIKGKTDYPVQWKNVWKPVPVVSFIGAVFILSVQPDHTKNLALLTAFAVWITHFLIGGFLFIGTLIVSSKYFKNIHFPYIIAYLLQPVLLAPFSFLLDEGFGNPDAETWSLHSIFDLLIDEVVALLPFSFLISASMTFVIVWGSKRKEGVNREEGLEAEEDIIPKLTDLFEGFPLKLGNELVRVEAKDHYVDFVTVEGSTLISGKLSDCVEKLSGFNGMQCHRSHWVNLQHVQSIKRTGSTNICVMSNADEVPISRRRWAVMKTLIGSLKSKS